MGSNDINTTGEKYKSKIRETVQEHITHGIGFYIVYKVELEKYDSDDRKEATKTVYLHSANRRILNMEEFDTVYDESMKKINEEFEAWMGEGSGLVMDRITSIYLSIAGLTMK